MLIILSGPSGVGKDAVLIRMKETGYDIEYITTTTTRTQRPGEQNGRDYHFVPGERFQEMIQGNELLEWANVYGNWYGVPKTPVREALNKGRDVIIKVDIQGATTIKQKVPPAIMIFLMPPSIGELIKRLEQRQTETPFDLSLRIKAAEAEIEQLPQFDYAVLNRQGEIDRAVSQIEAIIAAEKCRVKSHPIKL